MASPQTLSEDDQTLSDADRASAQRDQAAADSDQAASDRDLVRGGDQALHELTRELCDRGAIQGQQSAKWRIDAAAARDEVAQARDLLAAERDLAAERRDRELEVRDAGWSHEERAVTGAEIVLRASETRRRAASDRAAAGEARARAAADRAQAALDREQAARDRAQAQRDREELAHQLAIAETDPLTGARTRTGGMAELDREIDRARRTGIPVVVAYVDVVGLKAVNDARGHAAGDALLLRTARAIQAHMRSYDLIARLGDDEFLCVMSGVTIESARERFETVKGTLASQPQQGAIRVGFTTLTAEDTPAELIQRAQLTRLSPNGRAGLDAR